MGPKFSQHQRPILWITFASQNTPGLERQMLWRHHYISMSNRCYIGKLLEASLKVCQYKKASQTMTKKCHPYSIGEGRQNLESFIPICIAPIRLSPWSGHCKQGKSQQSTTKRQVKCIRNQSYSAGEKSNTQFGRRISNIKRNQHEQFPYLLIPRSRALKYEPNERQKWQSLIRVLRLIRKLLDSIVGIKIRGNINAGTCSGEERLGRIAAGDRRLRLLRRLVKLKRRLPGVSEPAIGGAAEWEVAVDWPRGLGFGVELLVMVKRRVLGLPGRESRAVHWGRLSSQE